MSHKGTLLRDEERGPREDSRREQWHWTTQQRFQSPEGVGAITVSTYKGQRAEPMTHIKGVGWLHLATSEITHSLI